MKIFQIVSTPIRVHWSLLGLVTGLMIWQYTTAGTTAMLTIAAVALGVFSTVLLHELAHVLVAKDFEYDTESITLYPFGGIARIEMPERIPPHHEIYIALAGPLVNAMMALVFLPMAYFLGSPFGLLFVLNFAMFAFNMLPSYPMDGGRVMRSLLARRFSHERATNIAIGVSRCFAWMYFAGGALLRSPMLVVIGAYLLYLLYYRIRREAIDTKK